jgi:hypothetical protein
MWYYNIKEEHKLSVWKKFSRNRFSCRRKFYFKFHKGKVMLSLCFYWASRHEGVLGEWRCSSHSLFDPGTRWRWVVRFTPRPLYPQGKSPWYTLDRRLSGPQSRSGRGGEEKNSQPPPRIMPHEKISESGSKDPRILNPSIISIFLSSFTLRPLFPRGIGPRYPLDSIGPQSRPFILLQKAKI